jgi:hypothetical protein
MDGDRAEPRIARRGPSGPHAPSTDFREAFRNRLAMDYALVPLLATAFQLLCGLIFAALALIGVISCFLALSYGLFDLDPFSNLPSRRFRAG